MDQFYFREPFATNGDRATIPVAFQPDGTVSYDQGWTFDYQRDYPTDPLAKPVSRQVMNQALFALTQAVAQYQQQGTPEWITAADNGGTPFAYAALAKVHYRSNPSLAWATYYSTVDNNTDTPGTTATWQLDSSIIATQPAAEAGVDNLGLMTPLRVKQAIIAAIGAAGSKYLPGQMVVTAGQSPLVGTIAANGAAISRSTYAGLFAAIGTTYGAGDGSTTFNVPNITDGGALVSGTGAQIGVVTTGAVKQHDHLGVTFVSGYHVHNTSDPGHTHQMPLSTLTPSGPAQTGAGQGISFISQQTGVSTTGVANVGTGDHSHNIATDTGRGLGTSNLSAGVKMLHCIAY